MAWPSQQVSLSFCAQRFQLEWFLWSRCSVSKQRFDHDFYTLTILMKTDLHIQDRTDFCIFKNPPSRSECFLISRQRVLSTQGFQFLWSFFFFKCNEELSSTIFKPRSHESSLSLEFSDRYDASSILSWSFCIKCDEILSSFDCFQTMIGA